MRDEPLNYGEFNQKAYFLDRITIKIWISISKYSKI